MANKNISITEASSKFDGIKARFMGAAKGMTAAFGTFKDIVKDALAIGVDIPTLHAWGKEAGVVPQTVNKALRELGVRQRGERSDKGGKKEPTTPEADGGATTKTPEGLAAYAVKICGGDKKAALELLLQAAGVVTR